MEPVTIKRVSSKQELKTFIRFNYEFYKDSPYSVPDLYDDMLGNDAEEVGFGSVFGY